MANDLNNEHNIKVSARTVRRRLQTSGLKYCRAKKKPLLTTAARKKCLACAREYIDFGWRKVLFTDESRFCLVSDRPVSVRRRQGEEYLPECLNTTMKHGGGGIMVWAVLPRVMLVVCTKSLERYADHYKKHLEILCSPVDATPVRGWGGHSSTR